MENKPIHTKSRKSYTQSMRKLRSEELDERITRILAERMSTKPLSQISLKEIAEDAQTTVQTVIRRFGGMAGLISKSAEIFPQICGDPRRLASQNGWDVWEAIRYDYDENGIFLRNLIFYSPEYTSISKYLKFVIERHKRWVGASFSQIINEYPCGDSDSKTHVLNANLWFPTWRALREDFNLGHAEISNYIIEVCSRSLGCNPTDLLHIRSVDVGT